MNDARVAVVVTPVMCVVGYGASATHRVVDRDDSALLFLFATFDISTHPVGATG